MSNKTNYDNFSKAIMRLDKMKWHKIEFYHKLCERRLTTLALPDLATYVGTKYQKLFDKVRFKWLGPEEECRGDEKLH